MKKLHTRTCRVLLTLTACTFLFAGCNEQKTAQTPDVAAEKPHASTQAAPPAQDAFSFDGMPAVVARVNGVEIEKNQLEKIYRVVSAQAQMTNQPINDKELVDMALSELINAELLKQETERKKIAPSKESVDKEMAMIQSQFPDAATFEKTITEKGLTIDELRANIKNQMAVKEMFEKEIDSKINVTDKMIEDFYNENPQYFKKDESVKASHILIKQENWEDKEKVAQGRKKIESILERVKKGEDFAELAKTTSEGPSAPNGGDLGFFGPGQMVKPFEEAAFKLGVGEVSGIVETNFGFHIIKVYEKKPGGVTPLEEATKDIKAYLSQVEGKKLVGEYMTNLRAASSIETLI